MKLIVKITSLFLLILLGIGCAGNVKQIRVSSSLIRNINDETVALVFQDEGEYHVYCTGVWISEDEILTAHHCMQGVANMIAGSDEVDVDPEGVKVAYIVESENEGVGENPSAVHFGKAVYLDDLHDLAIVKAIGKNIPSHEVAELASTNPAVGERIHIVGHVKGFYWTYITGNVAAYRGDIPGSDKVGPFTQLSAPVFFGNSGGGVFDNDGKLIGIVSFMARAPLTNFAISLPSISKMLKEYRAPQVKLGKSE